MLREAPRHTSLVLTPNIPDPDGYYEELIDSQRNLSEEEAQLMNCKLILLLANHIGNRAVLTEALKAAGGKLECDHR
ncbi:DUF2783 domain-containing protein [Xanthobacter dioxanivorans]|uniref:DUF2783 domain-containing protein n=1 Tax=Xanthobacter dioxanivorans TaxID=2528964 RepID=A0A974SJ11_9HYPH|nr:DUF2783 domain-containing protein [Xanthobacter dioxanivorans]QRG07012.1 DUF2783 domain-containing protein [Xanthobacter dioxanivorans]